MRIVEEKVRAIFDLIKGKATLFSERWDKDIVIEGVPTVGRH